MDTNWHRERTRDGFWDKDANKRWISESKTELNGWFYNHPDSPKECWNSNQEANALMIAKLDERYAYAKVVIYILIGVIVNAYGW